MTIKERIAELRKIEAAATPTEWYVEDYRSSGDWRSTGLIWQRTDKESFIIGERICRVNCDNIHAGSPIEEIEKFEANAAFIATARNTYPALLDALSEAVEALEFYAAGGSLNASTHDCGAIYIWEGGGTDRPGAQARAALESIEERLWR